MAIFDIFSKRLKRLESQPVDIFTYDVIPRKLRVQVIHILNEALGGELQYKDRYTKVRDAYTFIVEVLSSEYGLFNLFDDDPNSNSHRNHYRELVDFILSEKDANKVIDAIELSFRLVDTVTRNIEYFSEPNYNERADEAVLDLNNRFLENAIGYQYENRHIIRIDSKLLHSDVIKPVLSLLKNKHFAGAEEEFLKAYDHYRHQRNKEAIAECLKTFESLLKGICDKNRWAYSSKDTAKKLLDIIFEKEIIPEYLQSEFTSLRSLLESGIPTVRNRVGGHGQGNEKVDAPSHLVSYAIHLTASSILFLVECENDFSGR